MQQFVKTSLGERVFLVRFATQYQLASTFLRFQEHFESRQFAGRIFSLEAFMDWYAATFGTFSYFEDWSGFNVPSTVFAPFLAGQFDPLLDKEKQLLERFEGERQPFYVIGVSGAHPQEDLTHELAHALLFTNARYRAAVIAEMQRYDTSRVERELGALGYAEHVLLDEVHAYLVSGDPSIRALASAKLQPLRRVLRRLFRSHGARLIRKASTLERRGGSTRVAPRRAGAARRKH